MRALYSSLRCPHCGAKNFKITSGDIFHCEYCNQKFNYDLDKIDFTSENKIFIQELKEEFNNKLMELSREKSKYKALVVYYSKLANSRKLTTAFFLCIMFSICVLFTGLLMVVAIISSIIFSILFGLAKLRSKKLHEKYQPLALLYASLIVEIEEQVTVYTRLISKLTK